MHKSASTTRKRYPIENIISDIDIGNRLVDTAGKERVGCIERAALTY